MYIAPIGNSRVFRIRTKSFEELKAWASLLNLHIGCSKGKREDMFEISTKKQFWRFPIISQATLNSIANTGDILLFQTKSVRSKLQRTLTLSKYDHVALLVKLNDDKIGIFDATSNNGVNLVLLEEFINLSYHTNYSKIVYRPLHLDRSEKIQNSIEDFIDANLGKRFRFSLKNMIFKKNPGKDDGFFCSELVASALQEAGILTDDTPTSRVMPKGFSQDKLRLTQGEFGSLMLIDFELK